MPTPPHRRLLLSVACASSMASGACAFQSGAPPPSVGGGCSLVTDSAWRRQPTAARRRGTILFHSEEPGGQASVLDEMELYGEDGEELDVRIDIESMGLEEDKYSSDVGKDAEDGDVSKKRLIECSASILLPFSQEVAFDAFSDLTRQPSWCKYLHAVEYIGLVDENEATNGVEIPLRSSKWTVGVKAMRFSWTANDTRIERPHRIEWESTSGMKNMGSVEFVPLPTSDIATQMTVSFTFVAPRVVSSLFRRSGKIRRFTEDVLLMSLLEGFRDVVVDEDLQ